LVSKTAEISVSRTTDQDQDQNFGLEPKTAVLRTTRLLAIAQTIYKKYKKIIIIIMNHDHGSSQPEATAFS